MQLRLKPHILERDTRLLISPSFPKSNSASSLKAVESTKFTPAMTPQTHRVTAKNFQNAADQIDQDQLPSKNRTAEPCLVIVPDQKSVRTTS